MRGVAWGLLLALAFAIPWEYSLDFGAPFGNIARIAGVLALLAAILAVAQAGRIRAPGALHISVAALFLWFCCSYFWSIDPRTTLAHLPGYFQEMMIVWLVWEQAETPEDVRALLNAFVAGSWVLALLTIASFATPNVADQVRFAAAGQDPNDVARFLDLGFPLAALLLAGESTWAGKLLAFGYLPLGLAGVLLTASRGGFLAALVAIAGCAFLLLRNHTRGFIVAFFALPPLAAACWLVLPRETLARIATIPDQLSHGDLNQRLNIWAAGGRAFVRAPWFGSGAGSFVGAAGLAPIDTAHNTALALGVEGGAIALMLAAAIVWFTIRSVLKTDGSIRIAFATALAVWLVTSLVSTVAESRSTWLLLGLICVAGRLAMECPQALETTFSAAASHRHLPAALEPFA